MSICPRCGHSIPPVDDAPAPFCSQCGLPQLRVAEEAITPQAHPAATVSEAAVPSGQQAAPGHTDWISALWLTALAALLGVVPPMFAPGAISSGGVGGLTLILTPALTLGLLAVYHRRRPIRRVTASVGARLGALLGLFSGSLIAFLTGVAGFWERYGRHTRTTEDVVRAVTEQMLVQMNNTGPAPPPGLAEFVRSSEFRAGMFLMEHVLLLGMLVLVGSVCGALAGSLLKARRQRHIG
jgi:hypothetical protein